MWRNPSFQRALRVCALGLWSGSGLAFALPAPCERVSLSPKPLWISSGLWDSGQLVVVDSFANTVHAYDTTGRMTTNGLPIPGRDGQSIAPLTIQKAPSGGWLVSTVDSNLVTVGRDLRVEKSRSPLYQRSAQKEMLQGISSLYDWTLAGDSLVGYGSAVSPRVPGALQRGFFRAPLASPSRIEWLLEYEGGKPYLLGLPLITSIGSTAYFVELTDEPRIFVAEAGRPARPLSGLPPEIAKAPRIEAKLTGPKTADRVFAEMERETMVVGLFGLRDHLYVLGRKVDSTSQWLLYSLDPNHPEKGYAGPAEIRSQAAHLTLLVASDQSGFAAVERGKVGPGQTQEIGSYLWLDASSLETLSSGQVLCGASR